MKMVISPKLLFCAVAVLPLAAQVPRDVPAQYQAIYSMLTTQISAFQTTVDQNWDRTAYPVTWAPHLSTAESDNYMTLLQPNYYTNTVLPELQEIQATGAKGVTVMLNFPVLYQPFYTYSNNPTGYAQFLAFYQQLATDVHSRGMKLIMEALVAEALDGDEGADFVPYYQTLTWNEYMTGRAQHAVNVAQLIKPDYLSLICEPDTEAADAYQPTEDSPDGALQLLQTILTAFQEEGVKDQVIGAGAGSWIGHFTTYIQEFSTTSLNYIDIHVYPVNENFLSNVLTGMSLAQQSGKGLAISETWVEKMANNELGKLNIDTEDSRDVFSFWAPIDIAFLQSLVDLAQYEKLAFFSPSYPGYFAAYLDYNLVGSETPAQLLPAAFDAAATATYAGTFTSTGVAFSTMIAGADKTPPSRPETPTAQAGTNGINLSWTPSTDNVGVAGYRIYRDGEMIATQAVSPFYDTGLAQGVTYTYNLTAFDVQGNVSGESPGLAVTTVDLTPPSVPTHLEVTGKTNTSVSLSWTNSTGGGGLGGYHVLKGTSQSDLSYTAYYVAGTTYTDPHVGPNKTYYYAVESYNTWGVTSAASAVVSVTTP